MTDRECMEAALALAREAAAEGEVPVGCVITRRGEIVGRGRNRRETRKTALGHAEIEAIDCTLYVTLEPCSMCAGAIINARIPRVVYGARDGKYGACGSVCNLFEMDFNHHPACESGLMEEQVQEIMTEFFRQLRQELRSRPKWKPKDPQI